MNKWLLAGGTLTLSTLLLFAAYFRLDVGQPTWVYQLQDASIENIALLPVKYAVIDSTKDGSERYSKKDIAILREKGIRPISYLSIGEASSYLPYWKSEWGYQQKGVLTITDSAPEWMGHVENPDWPESVKVRYWNSEWQQYMFEELKRIQDAGFKGVYLDIIDAYLYWGDSSTYKEDGEQSLLTDPTSPKDAAERMISFVRTLSAVAKERDPDFLIIPQNGEEILQFDNGSYLKSVDGIGVEDIWFNESKKNNSDEIEERLKWLSQFSKANKPVFSVDYVKGRYAINRYYRLCRNEKFYCFAAAPDRSLSSIKSFD
ncbi:MJ1477/TM1410 family putative glycoside hydrolase [Sporosarcina sp. D27]|uniref:MJ1477/TM1410 family putative glycoside hydrolase n=1 Tax=Sporosarcina sp. D27 TaxID=1382305 RepID=UPI00046F2B1C|nr:MJ1477/TM1410 family putative glycoside hydrolase [Sporosarcina sp. D27]